MPPTTTAWLIMHRIRRGLAALFGARKVFSFRIPSEQTDLITLDIMTELDYF